MYLINWQTTLYCNTVIDWDQCSQVGLCGKSQHRFIPLILFLIEESDRAKLDSDVCSVQKKTEAQKYKSVWL